MGIDVRHIDKKLCLKPETAKIQGGLEDEVVKRFHILKDMLNFITAGDAWHSLFRLGFQDLEEGLT